MSGKTIIDIYIRLVAHHEMELFYKPEGTGPVDDLVAAEVIPKGSVRFHFIVNANRGHHWPASSASPFIETADLIIVPQTVAVGPKPRRGTPFDLRFPGSPKDLNHFFPDPAPPVPTGTDDEGWSRPLKPGSGVGELDTHPSGAQSILAGSIQAIHTNVSIGPFKYAIVAICDNGAKFCSVDPTIKIEP